MNEEKENVAFVCDESDIRSYGTAALLAFGRQALERSSPEKEVWPSNGSLVVMDVVDKERPSVRVFVRKGLPMTSFSFAPVEEGGGYDPNRVALVNDERDRGLYLKAVYDGELEATGELPPTIVRVSPDDPALPEENAIYSFENGAVVAVFKIPGDAPGVPLNCMICRIPSKSVEVSLDGGDAARAVSSILSNACGIEMKCAGRVRRWGIGKDYVI